jgi:MFS family permease
MHAMSNNLGHISMASKTEVEGGLMPWLVVFSAALFFFYEFIQMNMFSSLDPDLMRAFSINATQLSRLSSTYFYSNLLFLFPAGMILDRFSTRKVILTALLICSVGTLLFGYSTSVYVAQICRFFTGIGSAFCFLSSMRLASRWFPLQRLALITGLVVTMAMLGGMVAQTPLTWVIEKLGWRHALVVDAGLGFIIWGFIYWIVRDFPANQISQHHKEQMQLQELGFWRSIRTSYFRLQNWFCAVYTSTLNLPVAVLGAIFGSLYLEQVKHLSRIEASYAPMMIFIGTVVGSPLAGWLSDKIGKRKLPMMVGALLSIALVLIIIYAPALSLIEYIVLFLLLGFSSSTQIISYPTVAESNPRILTATSISVVSFTAIAGYPISQQLFGYLLDLGKDAQIVNNVHIYSAADYNRALIILPVAFAIGFIMTLLIRETNCKETIASK